MAAHTFEVRHGRTRVRVTVEPNRDPREPERPWRARLDQHDGAAWRPWQVWSLRTAPTPASVLADLATQRRWLTSPNDRRTR